MADTKNRLLIIDDELEVCEILKNLFQNDGYDVAIACDGQSGLSLAIKEIPDCILLDIRFKKGDDGLTFLRKLRSYRHDDPELEGRIRRVPVVVLTGSGEGMRPLFELEGIKLFLQKPYDPSVLKEYIRKVLVSS